MERRTPADSVTSVVRTDSLPPGTANAWANWVAFSAESRARAMPRFEQFHVADTAPMRAAPVDLGSSRGARRFRTALRDGAREGPNFAGRFTVVTWGCGSPCVQLAVIDARSGRIVYWAPEPLAQRPLFRRDSRLLVEDPTGFVTDTLGHPVFPRVEYYEWAGDRLVLRDSLDAAALRLPVERMAWTCAECRPMRP